MIYLKKFLLLTLALFIAALNFNIFLKPLNLVTGGTQGVTLLLTKLLELSPSLIILLINIITLILSYFTLSKDETKSAIASTFLYPLFVKITSSISFELSKNLLILWSIIAGIICGITGGIIYKLNFSSGGITIINLVIEKYTKIKIALSNFIINSIIILFGIINFGIIKAIYSIIIISIGSYIIHIILKNKV